MRKFQLNTVCHCWENGYKLSQCFHEECWIHPRLPSWQHCRYKRHLSSHSIRERNATWEIIHAWFVSQIQMVFGWTFFQTILLSQNSLYYHELHCFSPSKFVWSSIFWVLTNILPYSLSNSLCQKCVKSQSACG